MILQVCCLYVSFGQILHSAIKLQRSLAVSADNTRLWRKELEFDIQGLVVQQPVSLTLGYPKIQSKLPNSL